MNIKRRSVISLILIIPALIILLTSCITLRNYYDDIDTDEVSSIDIYDLREASNRESGFYENIDPVHTLDETQHGEFLKSLAKIEFTDVLILFPMAIDPSFYYGDWVVRINYFDGSYKFISSFGYGESFDADGQRTDSDHYGCDSEVLEQFISQYLPEDVFN